MPGFLFINYIAYSKLKFRDVARTLLTIQLNVQESDTTEDDSSNTAG